MKNAALILGMMVVLAGSALDARANPQLESAMEEIGGRVKQLSTQIADPQQNAHSIAVSNELVQLAESCRNLVPDTVAEKTGAERARAQAEYQRLIGLLKSHFEVMGYSLSKDQNAVAQSVLKQAGQVRRDGHDLFK